METETNNQTYLDELESLLFSNEYNDTPEVTQERLTQSAEALTDELPPSDVDEPKPEEKPEQAEPEEIDSFSDRLGMDYEPEMSQIERNKREFGKGMREEKRPSRHSELDSEQKMPVPPIRRPTAVSKPKRLELEDVKREKPAEKLSISRREKAEGLDNNLKRKSMEPIQKEKAAVRKEGEKKPSGKSGLKMSENGVNSCEKHVICRFTRLDMGSGDMMADRDKMPLEKDNKMGMDMSVRQGGGMK